MGERLNTQDLVNYLIKKENIAKKNAEVFIREFFLLIEEGLEKDKIVKIKGLGAFKLIDVESRESVNVNTGERFEIQGHTKVSFTPDVSLKDAVNKPFAHFTAVVLNENVTFEDNLATEEEIIEEEEAEIEETKPVPDIPESGSVIERLIAEAQREVRTYKKMPVREEKINEISLKSYIIGAVIAAFLICIASILYICSPAVFESGKMPDTATYPIEHKESKTADPFVIGADTASPAMKNDQMPSAPEAEDQSSQSPETEKITEF